MNYQHILYQVTDGVASITLNSPDTLNALSEDLCAELNAAFDAGLTDKTVKIFVLKANGRIFSAGGNLQNFKDTLDAGKNFDGLLKSLGQLALKLKQMPKLLITAVAGAAAGAGANLALAGDLVIAAENAKFLQSFTKIAAVPDGGGSYLLSRSIGFHKAMELCLTARPLPAAEALELGVVYRVVPLEDLVTTADSLARELATGPLLAYQNLKQQMFAAYFADYEQYLAEVEFTTMRQCMESADFAEGVDAFLSKRTPGYQGN